MAERPVLPPRRRAPARPRPGMQEVENPFSEESGMGRGADEKGNEVPVNYYTVL